MEPGKAYSTGMTKYEDGTIEDWFKYERIKVLQDSYGRATHTYFAVIDTLKKLDKSSDNHSSKNICIPLTVGKLMTILNSKEITKETKTIRVKIEAEDGFNPNTDIDLNSLCFGASEEVNWGRGAKVISTEKSEDDLIITFNAIGHGLTDDNFAGKLIGKTRSGKLLFAYARLPWLEYLEPALSVLPPLFSKQDNGFKIEVEVQNFGQVSSQLAHLKIFAEIDNQEKEIASTSIPALKSFEKTVLELNSKEHFENGGAYNFNIIIKSDNVRDVEFKRLITPIE